MECYGCVQALSAGRKAYWCTTVEQQLLLTAGLLTVMHAGLCDGLPFSVWEVSLGQALRNVILLSSLAESCRAVLCYACHC